MFMLGAAWQRGLIPVSRAAIDRAIELNGVAVEANKLRLRMGAARRHTISAAVEGARSPARPQRPSRAAERRPLDALIERRAAHLEDLARSARRRAAIARSSSACARPRRPSPRARR